MRFSFMSNVMKPVSNSPDVALTLALFFAILGLIIIGFGIADYFMNDTMFSMSKEMSLLVTVIIGAVAILISLPVWKKMKIGYILSIVYFVAIIAFGVCLIADKSDMIVKFFYILSGIFGILDLVTPRVRKTYF